MGRWEKYVTHLDDSRRLIVIWPVDDVGEHVREESWCSCEPLIDYCDNGCCKLIAHKSFDRREVLERFLSLF